MIKGRKRHLLTDTIGLPIGMIVHPANVQDRDGAPGPLSSVSSLYPWRRHVFADGGYAGDKLKGALAGLGKWAIEIVKRSAAAKGKASFYCLTVGQHFQRFRARQRVEWQWRGWSAPLPGSTAIAAWQRTSRQPSRVRLLGSTSPA
jgi:transposase